MKVKIPQKIKMCSRTYTIKIDPKICFSAQATGLIRHEYEDIVLDDILPISHMNQIFLHEVLHSIEVCFGVKIDDGDIDRSAEGLLIFLHDNLNIEFDWSNIKEIKH